MVFKVTKLSDIRT